MAFFLAAWMACPFALFVLLTRARRARLLALAERFGGEHCGGWLAAGRILGEGFEIAVERAGRGYRTVVRVGTGPNVPGDCLLRAGFFVRFPDWSCAHVRSTVRQRAFLWEVSLPGLAQPDEGQKARILRWLCPRAPRPGVGEDLRRAGASEVWIEDGSVSISFRGVVTQRERLRSALDALLAIAAGARKAA